MTSLVADCPMPVAGPARSDDEVVELQLLLPRSQMAAIERAARARGMTAGQMLRRLIADVFPSEPAINR